MGKRKDERGSNPVEAQRKAERQKELKRQKVERQKARETRFRERGAGRLEEELGRLVELESKDQLDGPGKQRKQQLEAQIKKAKALYEAHAGEEDPSDQAEGRPRTKMGRGGGGGSWNFFAATTSSTKGKEEAEEMQAYGDDEDEDKGMGGYKGHGDASQIHIVFPEGPSSTEGTHDHRQGASRRPFRSPPRRILERGCTEGAQALPPMPPGPPPPISEGQEIIWGDEEDDDAEMVDEEGETASPPPAIPPLPPGPPPPPSSGGPIRLVGRPDGLAQPSPPGIISVSPWSAPRVSSTPPIPPQGQQIEAQPGRPRVVPPRPMDPLSVGWSPGKMHVSGTPLDTTEKEGQSQEQPSIPAEAPFGQQAPSDHEMVLAPKEEKKKAQTEFFAEPQHRNLRQEVTRMVPASVLRKREEVRMEERRREEEQRREEEKEKELEDRLRGALERGRTFGRPGGLGPRINAAPEEEEEEEEEG